MMLGAASGLRVFLPRIAIWNPHCARRCCRELMSLPKLGAADEGSAPSASGLEPGALVGPYELGRRLGAFLIDPKPQVANSRYGAVQCAWRSKEQNAARGAMHKR
jgi:hypothetical protein